MKVFRVFFFGTKYILLQFERFNFQNTKKTKSSLNCHYYNITYFFKFVLLSAFFNFPINGINCNLNFRKVTGEQSNLIQFNLLQSRLHTFRIKIEHRVNVRAASRQLFKYTSNFSAKSLSASTAAMRLVFRRSRMKVELHEMLKKNKNKNWEELRSDWNGSRDEFLLKP